MKKHELNKLKRLIEETEFYVIKMGELCYYCFPDKNAPLYSENDWGASVGNPLFATRVFPENGATIPQKVKEVFPRACFVKTKWVEEKYDQRTQKTTK